MPRDLGDTSEGDDGEEEDNEEEAGDREKEKGTELTEVGAKQTNREVVIETTRSSSVCVSSVCLV